MTTFKLRFTVGVVWVGAVLAAAACTRQSPQQPVPHDAHTVPSKHTPDVQDEPSASGGEPCGPVKCGANEVCCNASCGVCTPPGGVCTQQFCEPDPVPAGQGAGEGVCQTDSDCSVNSDYCKGCDCRALGPNQTLPPCQGPGVRCFADPCMGKVAVCKAGRCEVASTRSSKGTAPTSP